MKKINLEKEGTDEMCQQRAKAYWDDAVEHADDAPITQKMMELGEEKAIELLADFWRYTMIVIADES